MLQSRPGNSENARRTRVVLPMITLVPGGMGGSETYARALATELARRDELDVVAVVSKLGQGVSAGVREVVARRVAGGPSTAARLATLAQGMTPGAEVRHLIRTADVIHYPLSVPVPSGPRSTPMIQTLLDVQHHDLPELFSRPELLYRRLVYDRPAQRAEVVITISEFSKAQIVKHLGLPPERVTVAHLGVDAGSFCRYDGQREPFVLYPARIWPHKNHARLIAAMTHLRRTRPELRLVLTGGGGGDLGDVPPWVEHRGLVTETELRELYRRASCLAFPSLYEGFGLPPLEAMASGCPVAVSTSGSLPEVCGEAAIAFDPENVHAMADAIDRAIAGRDRLAPLGLDRARMFSWSRSAEVHANVYRELARA
ncbi:MAG: glycosyltransferase family 1 protein [Marmoricola sp.]|nr:glycosyltransferase family 1 protein [Marmoricola sp.]